MDNLTSDVIVGVKEFNLTITELTTFECPFLNLPDNKIECSVSHPDVCITCRFIARYYISGDLDQESPGHLISLIIWSLTVLFGIFGACANCLILIILSRKKGKRSFDYLIGALAIFDFLATTSSVTVGTAAWAIFGTHVLF